MTILAVDTSGACASVAILASGKLIYESSLDMALTHSETLAPMIDTALTYSKLSPADIDLYAAAIGPGSFTGIRIGIAAIQALAHATGKKVIVVNTLDGLAANAPGHRRVCALIDARNRQVYAAIYNTMTGVSPLMQPAAASIDALATLMDAKGPAVFVGDGAVAYKEELKNMFRDEAEFLPLHMMQQKASSIGYIAHLKAEEGNLQHPFELTPLYLKKTQAEMKHGKRGEG